ncbi:MAG: hypothetical protein QOG35_1922 [Solirubrobacteraceae bacterium]|nr:hypothetical protein [Solirubrobacteraceae bacterium]
MHALTLAISGNVGCPLPIGRGSCWHPGQIGGRLDSNVSALPVLAKAGLAAIVCASMWRAFLGAPAPTVHRCAARVLFALTSACYVAGALAVVLGGGELLGALLIVVGIESSCVAAWLLRGSRRGDDGGDDGGGGGGGGGRGPKAPPPIDWDAFDRARRAWDRDRTPVAR